MRYLSVCSGIEAASVAFHPLGWTPVMFSEIEPFPIAVLKHHYPDVPVHGDFRELIPDPPMCDLLCGGTPCQAFSVAGLRESLADDRGNLTLQFILLANAIDHLRSTAGLEPAWILWENVPGVFSTSDNAFGAFLGGLCGSDQPIPEPENGWPSAGVVDGPDRCAAWRVLDAQHFGLAQRRKRVFVLSRGGAGRWAAADALLPIIQSSDWHPAPIRGAGKGVAACSIEGADQVGAFRWQNDSAGIVPDELTARLKASGSTTDERSVGAYLVFDPAQVTSSTNRSSPKPGDPCHTLHQSEPPILVRMREGKEGGGKGPLVSEDQSLTLATANDQILAFQGHASASNSMNPGPVAPTMDKGKAGGMMTLEASLQVRRLTPTECERLQGFPDGYTDIPWKGKPAADGPRYKALGNSWAVPCAAYIGRRIQAVS